MTEVHDSETQGCLLPFFSPLKFIFGQDDNPTPQYDAFYGYNEFESTLNHYPPGTLLRSRPIQVKSFIGLKGSSMQAWQLAYTTTGPLGSEVTVCTVIIPPTAGKRDKIVVHCPKTDSANAYTRTSWVLRKGNGDALNAASEQIFMAPFLDRGFIVVVPDYEGQRDSFGCGVISGKATLDAIRATLAFGDLRLAPRKETKIVIWGYSGGAIAASWAAQYLEGYAADLNDVIVGVSIGGLPANLLACALHINATPTAGLIIGIVQGLANAYPKLQAWLDVSLTKQGKEAFQVARTQSFDAVMLDSVQKDILNVTPADDPSFFERHVDYWEMETNPMLEDVPNKIVGQNSLMYDYEATKDQKLIPKVPIYLYEAISDEICPIAPVDSLVATWKKNGAIVEYVRVKGWLHVGLLFANHSETVQWIQDRLQGTPLKTPPGRKGFTTEASRSIADPESCASLKQNRAQQLQDYFEKDYEKTGKSWF